MKIGGIILIVIGVLMLVFNSINFTTKEKVVDMGPLEINKEKEHNIGWPIYIGAIVTISGVVLLVGGNRKR